VGALMSNWLTDLRRRSLAFRAMLLAGCIAVILGIVAPIANHFGGSLDVWGALAAASVCLVAGELALLASHIFRGPNQFLWGVLFGMAVRMGLPLVFALFVQFGGTPLAKSAVLIYLVIFFTVTLAVETTLSLPDLKTQHCND